MGQRKREIHPWTTAKLALETCRLQLGEAALAEACATFRLAFGPKDGGNRGPLLDRLDAEERQTCAADILFVLERVHKVTITGGAAALLEVAAANGKVRSADQFESMRKAWDEALRRARKRETWMGEHLSMNSPREMFELVAFMKPLVKRSPRRPPTPDQFRAIIRFHLSQMERGLHRLDARALRSLLRKLEGIRKPPARGQRIRLLN